MKKLLGILVLGLFLITPSWADDIRDFEIEEMSIGDSLLNYYSQSDIKNNLATGYKDNEFSMAYFKLPSTEEQWLQIHFKTDDKKFTIYGVDKLFYPKTVDDCLKERNKIVESVLAIFTNLEKQDRNNWDMASGHGKIHGILFKFNTGDFVEITCYEYNKDYDEIDHGRVAVVTQELNEWVINKAHK